jgi:hypothetical protein
MTKTEQILAAIEAKLTAAGINCRADTAEPYSFESGPAVIVDCGNEVPVPVTGAGFIYWDMEVTLWVAAEGTTPKLAPEPTRAAAYAALYADRTLGGLVIDINAGAVNRGIDTANPALGITESIYQIKYRSPEGVA